MHFLFCACATKLQTNPCTREEKTLEDGRVKPKLDSTLSDIGSEGMCRVTKNATSFCHIANYMGHAKRCVRGAIRCLGKLKKQKSHYLKLSQKKIIILIFICRRAIGYLQSNDVTADEKRRSDRRHCRKLVDGT